MTAVTVVPVTVSLREPRGPYEAAWDVSRADATWWAWTARTPDGRDVGGIARTEEGARREAAFYVDVVGAA